MGCWDTVMARLEQFEEIFEKDKTLLVQEEMTAVSISGVGGDFFDCLMGYWGFL